MNHAPWIFAGLASSFVDIEPLPEQSTSANRKTRLDKAQPNGANLHVDDQLSSCRIFQICSGNSLAEQPVELTPEDALGSVGLKDQVLVFRYRGKFHAIDHECPHSSYPLSKGSIYDIEDFGIILSAGITCPKHGWAFDLHTGESDKGGYKMKVWDVEVRSRSPDPGELGDAINELVQEVWVRRKRQRIG